MNDAETDPPPKARILIVEDEEPVANVIAFLLTRADCAIAFAHTAKEGMDLAEVGNFDLITLDVDLPDGNGFNLCSRLKERSRLRDTPIVFVSGRACKEDRQRGLDVGAADYIAKPFEASEFVARILNCIERKSRLNVFHKQTDTNTQSLCNTP